MGEGYFIGRVKTQDLKTLGDNEKPKNTVSEIWKNVTLHVVSCFPELEVCTIHAEPKNEAKSSLCVFLPIPRWTSPNKYHLRKYHLGYLF